MPTNMEPCLKDLFANLPRIGMNKDEIIYCQYTANSDFANRQGKPLNRSLNNQQKQHPAPSTPFGVGEKTREEKPAMPRHEASWLRKRF